MAASTTAAAVWCHCSASLHMVTTGLRGVQCSCTGFWEKLQLTYAEFVLDGRRQESMKVIVYGSLMNRTSLESVLQRPALLSKIAVAGWKRVFNAPFDGYSFLNLRPAENDAIEAAYFELDPSEQQLFAEREAGADLIEVVPGFYAFIWPEEYCRDLPALQSYIDICSRAAGELGVDFASGVDWPEVIIDDKKNPEYSL
jgi:hypothetical protein